MRHEVARTSAVKINRTSKSSLKWYHGCTQEALIAALNPVIVGWANYHRSNAASRVFAYLDSVLYWQLRRWARRRHLTKAGNG
ncbi:MAG: group II intron maturase-specific domain-containing protein [Cyanobacteria bacterium P01_B01_bin.77]